MKSRELAACETADLKTYPNDEYTGCSSPKQIEYGLGYITIRSPYTPYSIYLRGTIHIQQKTSPQRLLLVRKNMLSES